MIETRTSVYDFHFHLVFVTKYRKSIFDTTKKQEELKMLMSSFAEKNGSTIENVEVMPDHVHLVLSFPPKFAPSSIEVLFVDYSLGYSFSKSLMQMYVPTRKVIRNAIRNTYKASGADRIAPRIIKAAPMMAIDPNSDAKHETAMIDLFDIDFPF